MGRLLRIEQPVKNGNRLCVRKQPGADVRPELAIPKSDDRVIDANRRHDSVRRRESCRTMVTRGHQNAKFAIPLEHDTLDVSVGSFFTSQPCFWMEFETDASRLNSCSPIVGSMGPHAFHPSEGWALAPCSLLSFSMNDVQRRKSFFRPPIVPGHHKAKRLKITQP